MILLALVDRLLHGIMFRTPLQAWWFEHVCIPAAQWEMPD